MTVERIDTPQEFSLVKRAKSFTHAGRGLWVFFKTTHNAWIHIAALYLLVHGLVKGFLIWGLLKNKLWAYPASLVFIGLIVFYQIVSLVSARPLTLAILTLFDIIVAFLIWHEYKILMRRNIMVNDETR